MELRLEPHALDLTVPCGCGACAGEECRGTQSGIVHFGRRVDRVRWGTCAHTVLYDLETLAPIGPECGAPAVQIIVWRDGRRSPACAVHGVDSLAPEARDEVARVEAMLPEGR